MGTHAEHESCADIGRVLVLIDPAAWFEVLDREWLEQEAGLRLPCHVIHHS